MSDEKRCDSTKFDYRNKGSIRCDREEGHYGWHHNKEELKSWPKDFEQEKEFVPTPTVE